MTKVPNKPLYSRIDGILYPSMFSEKCFREALSYKAQPNDVFIVTYPKCGTTWMQHIAMSIFLKGKELENSSDFIKYCPFLDMLGLEGVERMVKPGAMKTHLPYSHLPLSSEAKYVFVARNPKDCCVSFYHHARSHPGFGFLDGGFEDFFELFMKGELEYNDYFDHLLSWYPHRNESNVFYTTFEEMKKDITSTIISLSKFLGKEYIEAIERDNSVLKNIINFSSFEYMQNNYSRPSLTEKSLLKPDSFQGIKYIAEFVTSLKLSTEIPKGNNVRKGIVGDWKSTLNQEQSERLTEKFLERTKGTEIQSWFASSVF